VITQHVNEWENHIAGTKHERNTKVTEGTE